MDLFLQIHSLHLSNICLDDQKFVVNLNYAFYRFFGNTTKVNSLLHRFIRMLHLFTYFSCTRSLLIPYTYVPIKSTDCITLSSFELTVIILISSVKSLCLSLLNLYCVFNIDILFLIGFLWTCFLRTSIIIFFLENLFCSSWVVSKHFL